MNGKSYILNPGMIGWVRAPDRVTHKVSEDAGPTRMLVIWAPGGERRPASPATGNGCGNRDQYPRLSRTRLRSGRPRRYRSILLKLVIHLTQVTPTCSVRPRVGFPQESGRVRRPIRVGGGVLGLPGSAALARRIPLSDLRPPEGVASAPPAVRVCRLWPPDVRHGWDDLPGHPQPAHRLVSGDVGRHQSEDRDERADAAAGAGLGQLPNGLDLAAQAATGDGAAKPGPARRLRRSGRDVRRGRRGWRQWPRGQEKGPDCRRCRGRRPAAGPDSAAPGAGRVGE